MSKADQIVDRLTQLTTFIETANMQLAKGEVVNLSHLDSEVDDLCNQTTSLPPTDIVKVQPVMANMISKLEELGLALKDFQAELKSRT